MARERKQATGSASGGAGPEFPPLYRQALAAMEQVYAEMQEPWDDPAAELAFMMRVADDESLMKSIRRIQRRAQRRYFEIARGLEALEWMQNRFGERDG